ncbi:MAG: hypothetical protein SH847_07595 [Roseiflexaceae bacterium]|nr:hypothetical protein [Roseiflexaceae bacterium]
MPKSRKRWVYTPPKPAKPSISVAFKQEVEQKAQPIVLAWKHQYIQPPPAEPQFNYLIDIWTKWYRSAFYFGGTYASPHPNAISPTFETRYARMTYAGNRNFNLAYMRYTEQWWELFADVPLEEALHTIETTIHFHPV